MSSMNVRVPTNKVIDLLEKKLADSADYRKKLGEFYEATVKWETDVAKALMAASSKVTPIEVSSRESYHGPTVIEIKFNVPEKLLEKRPVRPDGMYLCERESDQIKNALSILRLTDDETVSASTFKSISKYL